MKMGIFFAVALATLAVDAQPVSLHMEHLFPDSAYRTVYGSCTDIWSTLRTRVEKATGIPDQFHEGIVDALVGLDTQVKHLAQLKRHMPDDLEHLLGVLQVMHGEYLYAMVQKGDELGAVQAISYFFKRIKQRLEKLLVAATS